MFQPSPVDLAYVESIRSFLQRPYPVLTGTWSGDQGYNTLLSTFDPLKAYLNLPLISGKLTGFDFLRAGLKFEIRLNGTRFHYGQLVLGFLPMTNFKTYAGSQTTASALTMFPSVLVDPSVSEVGTFTVPYVHPHHFIRLTTGDAARSLGTLALRVIVPLSVVSSVAVPTISYTVYVSLVDPIVNAFTAVSLASPLVLQEQSGGDSATRFVPEAMNFLATDINDVSVRAGMQGDNSVQNEEQIIGAKRSDMLFSTIFTKPNFVRLVTWPSEAPVNAVVDAIPVMPGFRFSDSSHFLYHLSRANRFWRGSLRYHVKIVASGFHSGRLIIGWEPSNDITDPTSIVSASNRMSIVVDLQQATDVYFTVPYMHPLPWLGRNNENGHLFFTVLNALATPSGEPTDVAILTWVYGSDDLEFAMPAVQITSPEVLQEQCVVQPLSSPLFGNITNSHSVPGKMVMGEKLTSVSDLVQKMALARTVSGSNLLQFSAFTDGFLFNTVQTAPENATHMAYLALMYVIMRGAVRYAATAYTASNLQTPVPEIFVGPAILGDASPTGYPVYGSLSVRNVTPNSMMSVPWYSPDLFALTRSPNNSLTLPAYTTQCRSNGAFTSWWYGAGKDFMFAYLIPPPIGV
nr:putative structural polyprotein [Myrmica rubra picorna-like virus 7]